MCFIRLHRWFYWLVPINSTSMCSTNENPFVPRFYSSDSNPSRVRVSGSASDKSKRCSRCSFLLLYECSYVNLQLNMCANMIKNEEKSQKQKHVHAIHFIDFEFSIIFVFIALTHSLNVFRNAKFEWDASASPIFHDITIHFTKFIFLWIIVSSAHFAIFLRYIK